jgi:LuxR family maltose regulon positive regulatory protein
MLIEQGRLRQAVATFREAERLIVKLGAIALEHGVDSHYLAVGLGEVLREWNDLDAAERHLLKGVDELGGRLLLNATVLAERYMGLVWIYASRGEHARALATLDGLTEVARVRGYVPEVVERLAAARAQLALDGGDLNSAVDWADASGLAPEDAELPFPRELAYFALARVRIAQGRSDSGGPFLRMTERLLERLQRTAEAQGRERSVLETLVLRALTQQSRRDIRGAVGTLALALSLAQPEGYVRLFAAEGAAMAALLTDFVVVADQRRLAVSEVVLDYARSLLTVCRSPDGAMRIPQPEHPQTLQATRPIAGVALLLDPLTAREIEVLRLLAEGATNAAIAEDLVVSVGAVKRHVYHLCQKRGVQNRMQAVARARALRLLEY